MRLPAVQRRLLFLALGGVALSGLAWSCLDLLYGVGPMDAPALQLAKTWLARVHGGFAMAALAAIGSLLASHLPAGWRAREHLASGLSLLASAALLIVTGYLLYYASGEVFRSTNAYAHIAIGVIVCGVFAVHWLASAPKRHAAARFTGNVVENSTR